MTKEKQEKETFSISDLKLEQFTFGIECENYVTRWRTDHGDTHETVSKICKNYNELLKYYRGKVHAHQNDNQFWLHSMPEEYESSISAHIHFKAKIPDEQWDIVKYPLYERVYALVKLFQIYFKNSPNKDDRVFSCRHKHTEYAKLQKLNQDMFVNDGRAYTAVTLNPGYDTLEFRYNDVPKDMNHLAMFYYILRIALNKDIDIPEIPDEEEIESNEKLNTNYKNLFSYRKPNSALQFRNTYKKLLFNFIDIVDKTMPFGVYDFDSEKYMMFKDFALNYFKKIMDEFEHYFTTGMSEREWSEIHKKSFCKEIQPMLLYDGKDKPNTTNVEVALEPIQKPKLKAVKKVKNSKVGTFTLGRY